MSLELKNICRTVNNEIYIDDATITFTPGSFNVLLGRTLAGKTSLMRLIAGLDKPTSGQVIANGIDVTNVPVQKRNISMVYQQFINYPNLTVFENIASPLRISGVKDSVIDTRVKEIAEMLHIEQFLQRLPLELSGGQQQRTAMARALIKGGELILFDEPLVNLDYKLREELRFELRELFKTQKTIAIYATTEPNEALALGGMTTLLREGKIIQTGLVDDVYNHPNSVEAAELFSEPPINIMPGSINKDKGTINAITTFALNEELKSLSDGEYQFGVRPHHISIERKNADDIAIQVKIDIAEISGSETFLHLSNGQLAIVVQLTGVHAFHTDTPIDIYFPVEKLYIFDNKGKMIRSPKITYTDTSDHNKEVLKHG